MPSELKTVTEAPIKARRMDTRALTKTAICVALLCVSSYIAIPIPFTPILITAQTILVNLIALVLTPRQSFAAMLVYTLLGICGLPVFSGGMGGLGKFLGPTGGYVIGFLIMCPLVGWLKEKWKDKGILRVAFLRYSLVTVLIGMPIIYFFAALHMCLVMGMDVRAALAAAVVPFILGDALKSIAASYLGSVLNRVLRKLHF